MFHRAPNSLRAAIKRPFRALHAIRGMEVPSSFRWDKRQRLVLARIVLHDAHGVPHGQITDNLDIAGCSGDALSITLQLELTTNTGEVNSRAMVLVPQAELDMLCELSFQFQQRGTGWAVRVRTFFDRWRKFDDEDEEY